MSTFTSKRTARIRFLFLLFALLPLGIALGTAHAQSSDLLAFVNPSGQLIVTSADGYLRWIVTNPGEPLAGSLGFTWSPDGSRLFFGVDYGGTVSLRVGDAYAQSWQEIGQVSSSATGGDWTANGSAILIADQTTVTLFSSGGGIASQVNVGQPVSAISPGLNTRPYLSIEHSLAPDGSSALVQTGGGEYLLVSFNGSVANTGITNDRNARGAGLWSDNAPLVAYWGYTGNSVLAAAYAPAGSGITADSGRAAPVTPVAWMQNSTLLLYRDVSPYIRAADLGCLPNCGDAFGSGVDALPSSAADTQTDNGQIFFRDGSSIKALSGNCVYAGSCLGSEQTLIGDADGVSGFDVRSGRLVYTSSSGTAVIHVDDCAGGGLCSPVLSLPYTRAGTLSPSGSYATIDSNGSLGILDFSTGAVFDLGQGIALDRARWN
ncbi:MAG: hypothetical protein U0670_06985 [Anaerolineae bacterium]